MVFLIKFSYVDMYSIHLRVSPTFFFFAVLGVIPVPHMHHGTSFSYWNCRQRSYPTTHPATSNFSLSSFLVLGREPRVLHMLHGYCTTERFFFLCGFVYFDSSYRWNHRTCDLFHLKLFIQLSVCLAHLCLSPYCYSMPFYDWIIL